MIKTVLVYLYRLNRFNFLTVQGIFAKRLPHRFISFNTQDFALAPLEKMSIKRKVSVLTCKLPTNTCTPMKGMA